MRLISIRSMQWSVQLKLKVELAQKNISQNSILFAIFKAYVWQMSGTLLPAPPNVFLQIGKTPRGEIGCFAYCCQ
jgi:hypothetical protein